jgi:hypothetical protein
MMEANDPKNYSTQVKKHEHGVYKHNSNMTSFKEKRRNVGKLNNELNIVNQLADPHFLLFVNF